MSVVSIHRTAAIVLRQAYLIRGSLSRILPMFIWVTIDIVLWGFITRYLNTITSSGFDFVRMLLGAVLLWDFFTRVMQGVTIAFFEDVWSRNFLNIFATPLSLAEYLTGLVLTSFGTSLVGLAGMLVLAAVLFGLSVFMYGALLVPFLLVLFMVGIAFGILGSALVLRLGPSAEWFIWPVPFAMAPFVGVFYPLSTLPTWMQYIGHLLPPSYVFEEMRAIISGNEASAAQLTLGGILAVLYILLACWYFATIYRHAVRTGLIARYSAENVG